MNTQALVGIFKKYNDFNDAILEQIDIDPADSVCLNVVPLIWYGSQGKYEGKVLITFGAIKNVSEVIQQLTAFPMKESEIGFLNIDPASLNWKSGVLRFRLIAERRDYQYSFTSRKVTIEETA